MAASVIKDHVLVLNKSWSAIRVTTVEHAVKGLAKNVMSVIDPDNYIVYDWIGWSELPVFDGQKYITTGRCRATGEPRRIRAPRVVILARYNKIPSFSVKLNMKNLWLRDGGRCQYSGKKVSLRDATKDHIIPESRGGKDTWDNLVTCCTDINRKKADRTPEEAGLRLLKSPREPKWSPLYSALYSIGSLSDYFKDWKPFLGELADYTSASKESFNCFV